MKTKVFYYKDYVGITAGNNLVNDPAGPGQLGVLIDITEVEIQKEALDFLKTLKKSNGSFGDVMCFGNTFGWCGAFWTVLTKDSSPDRDFEPMLLESQVSEFETPTDFITFIDSVNPQVHENTEG